MLRKPKIDLNCDLGESLGSWKMGNDEEIMPYITSANIACGFHAGDSTTMMDTIVLAKKHNVLLGAHPGFPDLVGFGRREMHLTVKEIYNIVVYQLGALQACIKTLGGILNHVKPHGALYNMAAKDYKMADAIASAVFDVDKNLILYGLSGSELINAGTSKGLKVFNEAFADRTYLNDGSLTPRTMNNSIISSPQLAVKQVLQIVEEGFVDSVEGEKVKLAAETICVHGDNVEAVEFAKIIYQNLKDKNLLIDEK